ncbi:MAG: chemotaxis response regulator protein-glutamate methylesterase [Clostridiales bacterium]|nr:chemotaxis response regulator protein-glutamate methylesterase [Clostridiales bacterium]
MRNIRIMIIDDSIMFREFLSRALAGVPSLEVVGTFADPLKAMEQIGPLKPDVLAVDMEMPKMRGDEFLRTVLPKYPGVNAVVISALSNNVFNAMHAGAVDFVGKPGSSPGYEKEQFIEDVIEKIKIAAAASLKRPATAPIAAPSCRLDLVKAKQTSLIAIGASTGGTEAIIEVIKDFPANTPGVVIVQHMPPVFTRLYAERLDKFMAMHVREAKNGDRVERGTVLVAPGGDQQLRVRGDARGYFINLNTEPKVNSHCPSVDVMFESVAQAAGPNAVGVILTGMGADGARCLRQMRDKGAHTIGQDQESCVVYGMPKVAYDMGGVAEQLPLSAIGPAVLRRFSR